MSQVRFAPPAPPSTSAANCRRQGGQGAVEFLLAAAPVLLLGLSSIEAIHWYFVRQAVSLALTQAGRAAITQHADPAVLDTAFAEALLPLHAGPTPAASRARLEKAIARREHTTGLPAWRIRIVSPSTASFADFASSNPDLGRASHPIIDNDYLHEQHQARLAQGWLHGRGPQSGQTTLEANTLVLHLTWLHEPLLPGMRQLLRQLAPPDTRYGSQAMSIGGYLPLHRQVALVMQSHPIEWQMPANGRIVRLSGSGTAPPYSDERENITAAPGQPDTGQTAPAAGQPGAPSNAIVPPPAGPAEYSGPGAEGPAQAPPCTGLWCLSGFGYALGAGTQPATGTDADSGPGPDNGYRDGESGPEPPAGPDDCPGCCA